MEGNSTPEAAKAAAFSPSAKGENNSHGRGEKRKRGDGKNPLQHGSRKHKGRDMGRGEYL
jgi:hypothetical protein